MDRTNHPVPEVTMPRIRTPHEGRHRLAAQTVEAGIKRSPVAGRNLPSPVAGSRVPSPVAGNRIPSPLAGGRFPSPTL